MIIGTSRFTEGDDGNIQHESSWVRQVSRSARLWYNGSFIEIDFAKSGGIERILVPKKLLWELLEKKGHGEGVSGIIEIEEPI